MAIGRKEFESGENLETADALILRFLREHPHQAFTGAEISESLRRSGEADGWSTMPREARLALFDVHLDVLVRSGRIEARRVRGPDGWGRHYACRRATKQPCMRP
jgi:hypothetical protein